MRPKTSPIWNYFLELSASAARCKVCEKQYSRKGRTTTALKSHLKSSHPEKYQEFKQLDEINKEASFDNTKQVASSSTSTVQAKIQISLQEENLNKNELCHYLTQKSQQMDRLIVEMIALQDLPFSFVEGIGFRRLMNTALPEYQLKERQFYTSLLYDDLYTRMRNKIKQLLAEFEKLSFIIDIWSELNYTISLVSLIAYGINKDFQRVKIALKCEIVDGSHTEQELSFKIQSVLHEWEIKEQTLHCIICDRSSNTINATMELSGINNLDCIIHQIHACIQSVIQSEEWLERLIAKLEKIIAHFNRSVIVQEELKKIQIEKLNDSPLSPVQDCSTRWNSLFYMMERFLKIKDSLVLYLSTKQITTISYDDWLNIEKCVKILKPFEEITRELSSSHNSISSVIPLIQVLLTTLQNEEHAKDDSLEGFKRVVKKLIAELNFRFSDLNKNVSYTVSTYLDPRYKAKFFNEIVIDEVETTIIHELFTSRYFDDVENEGGPSNLKKIKRENEEQPSTSRQQVHLFQYSDLEFSLESILSTNESDGEEEGTKDQLTMVKTMLDNYKKEKRLPLKEDPLTWWHTNAYKYSALVPIVCRFLSPPPSSVVNDQFFTAAVRIFDEDGNRLCGERAENILFFKYNLPLLDFNY